MKVKNHICCCFVGIINLCNVSFLIDRASAQIVPDATLNTQVEKFTEEGSNDILIEGDTTVGKNLFHSFKEFGVPIENAVYFNNDFDIKNIIIRVTGESISNLDGNIFVNGNTNFALINLNNILDGKDFQINGFLDENLNLNELIDTTSILLTVSGVEFNDTNLPKISLTPKSTITCSGDGYAQSSFTIVGRDGSVTPSYLEPLTGSLLNSIQLAKLEEETKAQREVGMSSRKVEEFDKKNSQIVEAQGWVKTKNGKIILVADTSNTIPSSRPTTSGCPTKK